MAGGQSSILRGPTGVHPLGDVPCIGGTSNDPNSAANMAVGPIPFHGMPTYPYPEHVRPPHLPDAAPRPGRLVLDSSRGWPGAVPQPLVADRDTDEP